MGFMIEIKDLEKKFDDVSVLSNVNLNIEEGSIYGLVGSSGAGKSTILSLIYKFYGGYKGKIMVGGYELADISSHDLRENTSFILQNDVTPKC